MEEIKNNLELFGQDLQQEIWQPVDIQEEFQVEYVSLLGGRDLRGS